MNANELIDLLAATPLFRDMEQEHLRALAVNARVGGYAAGEAIVRQTESARGFYMVVSGRVKVFKMSPDGREQTLYHFGPGEPFCLCALFEGETFMAHASALEDSEILFVPAQSLWSMGAENPTLLFNLLFLLARRLKEAMDMVESLSIRSLGERVALFVIRLGKEEGEQLTLPMTHRELAKIVGSSPEALSRTFRTLADQNVLSVDGRKVVIHDRAALARLAGALRQQ